MSLVSRLQHFRYSMTARPSTQRRRSLSVLRTGVELLEERTLLAGMVIEESVFSVTQFARNIEEQVPVDTTGPNGVVGYSYAIIDGDPANPISDAGDDVFKGNRRMVWDTPLQFQPRSGGMRALDENFVRCRAGI